MFASTSSLCNTTTAATPLVHLTLAQPCDPIDGMQHTGSVQAAAPRGVGTARNNTTSNNDRANQHATVVHFQPYSLPCVMPPHTTISPNDSFSSHNSDSARGVEQLPQYYTHSPYGANVIGTAVEPTDFAVVVHRRKGSSLTGSGSRSPVSSASSEGGHTPRSSHSSATVIPFSTAAVAPPTIPAALIAQAPGCEHIGRIEQLARTAHGCTTLQNMLKSSSTDAALRSAIGNELRPHFHTLLFDAHAAYVVRALISLMPRDEAVRTIMTLCADPEFLCALSTTSLHSRRVVQFFLDILAPAERSVLIAPLCHAVFVTRLALSEHGCVSIQRILDVALPHDREAVLDVARACLNDLAKHQHGNYVIQYMLRHGDLERNSRAVVAAFAPRIVEVSCDKFASNVLEKAFDMITPQARATLVDALYASPQWQLQRLLCDGVGNYIVQASIAHCSAQQIGHIHAQLSQLLPLVAYGSKIDAKLHARAQQLSMVAIRHH